MSVPVSSEEALTPPADIQTRSKPVAPTVVPVPAELARKAPPSEGPESTAPIVDSRDDNVSGGTGSRSGLWQAILIAVGGGFVSLLTPCVFPMIPITVSYFLKQSESKQGSAVLMALVYSGTIVLILSAGGLFLLKVSDPDQHASAHQLRPRCHLSLLRAEPSGLVRHHPALVVAGRHRLAEGKGGYFGVFFMALTFSIVSFSCVGPIYGGFISVKSAGSAGQLQLVLSVISFAVAFASPFFLLALFPGLIKSMPRADRG